MNKILGRTLSNVYSNHLTHKTLTNGFRYHFSEENGIILNKGTLEVRNSDTLELKLLKIDVNSNKVSPFNITIRPEATVKQLKEVISKQIQANNLRIHSEEGDKYAEVTPIESLLDRFFTIISDEFKIRVDGQFLHPVLDEDKTSWQKQTRLSLEQVEQPLLIQRQIESYMHRLEIWLDAKYGMGNQNVKIKAKQVQDILVQALVDPDCKWSKLNQIESKWREVYYQVQQLNKKYEQAVMLSQKKAKRRMYLDMILLASNVVFIAGGTYVVYSWDIIEPWAYFISSCASIYLFRKAAKFRKPFSLSNYKNYLIYETYLQKSAAEVGIDLTLLKQKKMQLQVLQTTLKDYMIQKI